METTAAIGQNPFLNTPGKGGDYRGGKGNRSIDQLNKDTIDPMNNFNSYSWGSLNNNNKPIDKETYQLLKGIIERCKKNFEEFNKEQEKISPNPNLKFPTEEKLPNGNIWLMDSGTGDKWGLLYRNPNDGMQYVKMINWEAKNLSPREKQELIR